MINKRRIIFKFYDTRILLHEQFTNHHPLLSQVLIQQHYDK